MKSEIKEKKVEFPYPKLMNSNNCEHIVLFTEIKIGTVVFSRIHNFPMGYHHNDWNMSFFEDFHGKVILEND